MDDNDNIIDVSHSVNNRKIHRLIANFIHNHIESRFIILIPRRRKKSNSCVLMKYYTKKFQFMLHKKI